LNGRYVRALAVASIAFLAACSGGSMNQTLPTGTTGAAPEAMMLKNSPNVRRACDSVEVPGAAQCYALIRTDIGGMIAPNVPPGYGPSDLQSAYSLPSSTNGKGQTVGIVDAFDDPNAEADLAVYRSTFGLPACTTKNKCFSKVGETGSPTKLPIPNQGWAGEISLDLDMVSANCPNCHILLVEADTNYFGPLGKSVDEAVKLGADVVSNSYGGGESSKKNPHYFHKGTVITASSDDQGYGPAQPCSYASVVCVGGTVLLHSTGKRGWTESAWSGAGSGCSAKVAKPSWQTDKGCTMRSESDVSAVASPATGVAVYDTYMAPGFEVFGGTSVSSPLIASVFALAGNETKQDAAKGIWAHGGSKSLNDVITGSNGTCPSQIKYICTAGPGYDGVTGWGTPNGIGAF
jgi:subtilase family serine protease